MMQFTRRAASVAALLLVAATAASAQTDSVLSVSSGGANLLRLNVDGGFVVWGDPLSASIPASGAGSRLMWVPGRSAFRAGTLSSGFAETYWDLSNIGAGSAAFGTNNLASGANSFAAGATTTASGDEAVALGTGATASADRSLTFNGSATAVGAIALGSGAQATGDDALALGPSSIAGGLASVVIGPSIANGNFGVAIGLQNSASGTFSVAIGKNARTAGRSGSVVIGDGSAAFSSDSVYATANNQFVVRGAGGIRFYTAMNLSSGVEVAAGGGSWSSLSDRNRKENFAELDGEQVLLKLRDMPVETWNYITQDREIRHAGPVAQDFFAAFGLGESELRINTIDIDGINLAAIKALETRSALQQERIIGLEAQVDELSERLARLESLVAAGRNE